MSNATEELTADDVNINFTQMTRDFRSVNFFTDRSNMGKLIVPAYTCLKSEVVGDIIEAIRAFIDDYPNTKYEVTCVVYERGDYSRVAMGCSGVGDFTGLEVVWR